MFISALNFGSALGRRVALTGMVLAVVAVSACAPKPEAVAAACPEPVMGHAKDGTLITLSEPCVLPERFELTTPVGGFGAPAQPDTDGPGRPLPVKPPVDPEEP